MSKKFNINDYPGKYVMHCKTEEEAKDFCRVLHEAGRKWAKGITRSYLDRTGYKFHGECTCYNFNQGYICDAGYYLNNYYTILEWSDFMNKEFTKDDLRDFDIVLRRDGDVRIVIGDRIMDKEGYSNLKSYYSDDLTSMVNGSHQDIMSVIRPVVLSDLSFDAFEKNLGRVVYERDETVEMTLEEVCKALGKNVKIVKE